MEFSGHTLNGLEIGLKADLKMGEIILIIINQFNETI